MAATASAKSPAAGTASSVTGGADATAGTARTACDPAVVVSVVNATTESYLEKVSAAQETARLARELAAARLAEEEKRLAVDQILMDAANQFEEEKQKK